MSAVRRSQTAATDWSGRRLHRDRFALLVVGEDVGHDLGDLFLAEDGFPGKHALGGDAGRHRVVDFLRRAAVDPGSVGEIGADRAGILPLALQAGQVTGYAVRGVSLLAGVDEDGVA